MPHTFAFLGPSPVRFLNLHTPSCGSALPRRAARGADGGRARRRTGRVRSGARLARGAELLAGLVQGLRPAGRGGDRAGGRLSAGCPLFPPATVLDVACGFGRHARALAARGYAVTGVERDPAVAAEARAGDLEVHELDVRRLDELEATCDAVISMWASFGWYADETNADVFAAMAAKAGRTLVLDVYDPAFFRARQGPIENRGVHQVKRVCGSRLQRGSSTRTT